MTLEEKAVQLLDKLEALAEEHTQGALDLAVGAVQAQAVASLALAFAALGVALLLLRVMRALLAKIEGASHCDEEAPYVVALVASGFAAVLFGVVSTLTLFSAHTWVSAFRPEYALALRIIS